MRKNLRVLCPNCGKIVTPQVCLEPWRDEPIDFQGDDPILVDHPELILTINCKNCNEKNIFEVNAGPLFFNWVGP